MDLLTRLREFCASLEKDAEQLKRMEKVGEAFWIRGEVYASVAKQLRKLIEEAEREAGN